MRTEEKVKKLIAEYFGIEKSDISPSSHFAEDFNIVPNEMDEFLLKIGDKMGVEIAYDPKEEIKTVQDLIDIIKDQLNEI